MSRAKVLQRMLPASHALPTWREIVGSLIQELHGPGQEAVRFPVWRLWLSHQRLTHLLAYGFLLWASKHFQDVWSAALHQKSVAAAADQRAALCRFLLPITSCSRVGHALTLTGHVALIADKQSLNRLLYGRDNPHTTTLLVVGLWKINASGRMCGPLALSCCSASQQGRGLRGEAVGPCFPFLILPRLRRQHGPWVLPRLLSWGLSQETAFVCT